MRLLPQAPAELANAIQAVESPSTLADLVASFMDIKTSEKQQLLETLDLKTRLDRVTELLTKRVEVLRLQRQIEEQTREAIDERQKEVLLREQMRQIRKQLGEEGESGEEIAELARGDRQGRHARGGARAGEKGAEASRADVRRERASTPCCAPGST